MKNTSSRKTLATIGLLALCVFLVVRLVADSTSVSATSQPPERAVRPERQHLVRRLTKTAPDAEPDFPRTPVLQLDLLQQEDSQPMMALDRNPFQFAPTPAQVRAVQQRQNMGAGGPAVPAPPVAPPVPYKALGYSENQQGQFQAYLADAKDIYVVHEGDDLGRRYKIVKITPTLVEVRDESFNQTSQLLFPQ
jgi:hypothetical protein